MDRVIIAIRRVFSDEQNCQQQLFVNVMACMNQPRFSRCSCYIEQICPLVLECERVSFLYKAMYEISLVLTSL
ncbi:unnamed protein product [Urochloa humidicola]